MNYRWVIVLLVVLAAFYVISTLLEFTSTELASIALWGIAAGVAGGSITYIVLSVPQYLNWLKNRQHSKPFAPTDGIRDQEASTIVPGRSKVFSKDLEALLHKALLSASSQRHPNAKSLHLARTILEEQGVKSLLRELGFRVDNVIQRIKKRESEIEPTSTYDAIPDDSFQKIIQIAVLRSEADLVTVWDAFCALVTEASQNDTELLSILRSGFSQERARKKSEQPKTSAEKKQWHEILGVTEQASENEIRVAYRRMIGLYHPDRVSGLGHDLVDLATRRAYEINQAYDTAKKLRG